MVIKISYLNIKVNHDCFSLLRDIKPKTQLISKPTIPYLLPLKFSLVMIAKHAD